MIRLLPVAALTLACTHAAPATDALPVMWDAPQFSLVDQDGGRLTRDDLRGRVWITDFIFTRCTSACPLLSAQLAKIARALPDPRLRFVSFSVDPAHDDPAALRDYAARWHGDRARWRLLATTPESLRTIATALHVTVAETDQARDPILHSSRFQLVDGAGHVRGTYDGGDEDALAALVRDAHRLLGEPGARAPRASRSDGRALYESLGCDGCHARAEVAPPLAGVLGRRVLLDDGTAIAVDAAYLRESIVHPEARRAAGYGATMPSYAAALTDCELDALVAWIAALPAAGAAPSPRARAVDPVCGMPISVGEDTPRLAYRGHGYSFCSARCRDAFSADPARFAVAAHASATGDGAR